MDIIKQIEAWYDRHFGNVTPGSGLHGQLQTAKRDLIATLAPTPTAEVAPIIPTPIAETPQTETQGD